MKSTRLIVIGLILLLAGVAGFSASLSQGRTGEQPAAFAESNQGGGFLPMLFAVDHRESAPTLQPAPAAGFLPGEPATPPIQGNETPEPTTTPAGPLKPDRIVIPKIELDAPVIPAEEQNVKIEGIEYVQFLAPDQFAAGWHSNSAPLGKVGNTVLNGHHNVHGKVFGRLVDLVPGDRIFVYSGTTSLEFQVANVLILPERDADLATRLDNARWIEPSDDIRLTLVTCWPAYTNTHRLIIVASPVYADVQKAKQQ
ncbi:sortase [Longilinea arvoryzae]|uniref:Sortase n=1 Tax=Longilinea arvoryzae TaxID=360412 RepID=A0A0S7BAM1_9CHLR|nr:sortase [Longilinea arvoryzae]GAP14526.1 sortase [Longilinea arvoryzae]